VEFTNVGKSGPTYIYRYNLKSRKITFNQVYVYEITKASADNMLVIDMNLPSDYDTHKEQFWIEFTSPWPNIIETGTLECLSTGNFEIQGCVSIDGNAAIN